MKSLKKILALMLALALTFALVACGDEDTSGGGAADSSSSTSEEDGKAPVLNTLDYLTENGFYKGVKALDIVELCDYSNIVIPKDVYTMTDEELQEAIDEQLSKNTSEKQVMDRAVADGDTVNIDYVGKMDGVEFSGGNTNGQGTEVTIGVTQYIDNFLEQLIGHKPGDTFDVNVTFPDSYPNNPDLASKPATFTTTINYIVEQVTPELTDAYVKETYESIKGWTTVEEFKQGLRDDHKNSAASDYITEYLVKNSTIKETPEICEKYIKEFNKWQIEFMCFSYNMDASEYYAYYGYEDFDGFYESISDKVTAQITQDLIFQAICEKESLTPTEDVMLQYFYKYYGEESGQAYYDNYCESMDIRAVKHTFIATLAIDSIMPTVTFAK